MKWTLVLLSALLVGCTNKDGEIIQGNDGMYWSFYDSTGPAYILYQADTLTQSCFAVYKRGGGSGITSISCVDLAKRPEWKPILSWVEE